MSKFMDQFSQFAMRTWRLDGVFTSRSTPRLNSVAAKKALGLKAPKVMQFAAFAAAIAISAGIAIPPSAMSGEWVSQQQPVVSPSRVADQVSPDAWVSDLAAIRALKRVDESAYVDVDSIF